MTFRTIRITNTAFNRWSRTGRRSARLSDGTYVAFTFDTAGGSPVWNLHTSPDNTTWTFRASVSAGTTPPNDLPQASICVDDSNNIYAVFEVWSSSAPTAPGWHQAKFTYSAGPSYSLTNNNTIKSETGSGWTSIAEADIDFVGNGSGGRAIVALRGTSGTSNTAINYYICSGATVTQLFGGISNSSTKSVFAGAATSMFAAIAGRHLTETDNSLTFAYIVFDTAGTAKTLKVYLANVKTDGTVNSVHDTGLRLTNGAQVRMFTSADREITIASMQGSGPALTWSRFTWNSSFVPTISFQYTSTTTPTDSSGLTNRQYDVAAVGRNLYLVLWPSAVKTNKLNAMYVDTSSSMSVSLSSTFIFENFAQSPNSPGFISSVSAGFNRNIESGRVSPAPIIDTTPTGTTHVTVGSVAVRGPASLSGLTPLSGATINTDTPALSVNLNNDPFGNQSDWYIDFQFARDPGFTSGAFTFTTGWGLAGTQFSAVLDVLHKLTQQGLWYYRARATNRFGVVGSWTATQTFTDSHVLTPTNMVPNSGIAIAYGSGVFGFAWSSTDSSPSATQSAYQIQVIDTSNNTVVADTGKTSSTQGLATVPISASYKDHPLVWTLTLWDDQNVQGPVSQPQSFFITDAPTPTITAPADGSTVTGSNVTVSWTPGTSGAKTEARYRLVIQTGTEIVFDTSSVAAPDTSLIVPTGVIHTDKSYIIVLTVMDSLGVEGTTVSTFSSDFVSPNGPDNIWLFDYNYQRYGYVWIGWDDSNIDPDFIFWNLYRKAAGETDWTLLTSIVQDYPAYGYRDYSANSSTDYTYAVTQVVNRDQAGDILESDFIFTIEGRFIGDYYWLIDSAGLLSAVPLYIVTSDGYTDNWERNSYTVIGRGRHVDVGEHLGLDGSLTLDLRDRPLPSGPTMNVLSDPSFQDNLPLSPEWTYTSTGDASYTGLTYLEPPPSGHTESLRIDAVPSAAVTVKQTPTALPFGAYADRFHVSCWIANLAPANSFTVSATVTYRDGSGASLGVSTIPLSEIEDYQGNGNWIRYGDWRVVPVDGTDHIDVSFVLTDTSGNGLSVLLTGTQMIPGEVAKEYTDGDLMGSFWNGVPLKSSSSSNGFYTARSQRQDIVALVALGRPLYLRTPFGDVFQVSLGDTALARLAGTGSDSEYGAFTIPYSEVAL